MKPVILSMVGSLLVLVLLLGLSVAWLMGSAAGARFALEGVGRLSGAEITVEGVQGRLWDRLRLSRVRVAAPKLTARIDLLTLSWEPWQLLSGRLPIRDLELAGVAIEDNTPVSRKPPSLAWPRVGPLARRLRAEVDKLRVTALSYRRFTEKPVLVDSLSASLSWDGNLVRVSGIEVKSGLARGEGELAAGLARPSLALDLVVTRSKPVAQLDRLTLRARLLPGKGAEQVAGPVSLSGTGAGRERAVLSAKLGITPSALLCTG
jgi:translocation and assembly module TamB